MTEHPPAFLPKRTADGMEFKQVYGESQDFRPIWHQYGTMGVVMVFVSSAHPRDEVVREIEKVLEKI